MHRVDKDSLLVAETTHDATDDFGGDAWQGPMTYDSFTEPVWGWLSEPGTTRWGWLARPVPPYTGPQVAESMTRFTSGIPWRIRLGTLNAIDSHDTARFATHARPGTFPVAVAMQMTLPGIAFVWMGDELGLTGANGEDSRTPMPWHELDAHRDTLDLVRTLSRIRGEYAALADGSMRWIAVQDDALAYVRESADDAVLVVVTRAAADVDVRGVLRLDQAALLAGGLSVAAGGVRADGPGFGIWALPGVDVPRATDVSPIRGGETR